MLDFSKCPAKPYDHQEVGVAALVEHPVFALFDEPGAGKSKQVIDAALILFEKGMIDRVIIVCPSPVKPVWFDPELGQLSRHLWADIPCLVSEYHSKLKQWESGPESSEQLRWIVTNYEYIRDAEKLRVLLKKSGPKTLLVLDESSAVKTARAQQTRACRRLRKKCGRVVLLNGTPIDHSPLDMYSQGNMMSPDILETPNLQVFRARYCVMGGWQGREIVGWNNLDDITARFAPYVLRRLKRDCLDLPEKMEPVTITATLTPATWKVYCEMRDDLITWLNESTASVAAQTITKVMRLSQITSGFIGGIEDQGLSDDGEELPEYLQEEGVLFQGKWVADNPKMVRTVQEISDEKLKTFLQWHQEQLFMNPYFKAVVWCRFRNEVERLRQALTDSRVEVGTLWGGPKDEREHAVKLMNPYTAPKGPAVLVGTPATGAFGLDFTAADTAVYMSNDRRLLIRIQSEDRIHRPGQTRAVNYFDVIAQGPRGQKTIDHHIIKMLWAHRDLAEMTTSGWIDVLSEE
jgi:hypothetical protein